MGVGPPRTIVIGLLGGVASGKTTVAKIFEELGAAVIDADALAHEQLQRPETKTLIRKEWGEAPFAGDGAVDRLKLARIAFATRSNVERLNAIMHPPILRAMRKRIRELQESQRPPAIVCDAALLAESGAEGVCDALVFVHTRDEDRLRRAHRERGWTAEELMRRERLQMPLERKRRLADYVVNNSGPLESTAQQVVCFWDANVRRDRKE